MSFDNDFRGTTLKAKGKGKGKGKPCALVLALLLLAFAGSAPARTIDGKKDVHNPCVDATVAQVADAKEVAADALGRRDAGDYEVAAAKYFQAADSCPLKPLSASYRMNGVGCLLGVYESRKGFAQYWWDPAKGAKNAQAAYAQLDQVEADLKASKDLDCDCSNGRGGSLYKSTSAWHDNQLAWLKSQVDRKP
jgi:hypothetical protein